MQPVLFLNKLLNTTKKNYKFIKLEVICLIYACYKLQVMLQLARIPVIMLTNHVAIKGICN